MGLAWEAEHMNRRMKGLVMGVGGGGTGGEASVVSQRPKE